MTHSFSIKDGARGEGVCSLNSCECGCGTGGNGYYLGSTLGHGIGFSYTSYFIRDALGNIDRCRGEHGGFEIFLSVPLYTLNCLSDAWQHLDYESALLDGSLRVSFRDESLA